MLYLFPKSGELHCYWWSVLPFGASSAREMNFALMIQLLTLGDPNYYFYCNILNRDNVKGDESSSTGMAAPGYGYCATPSS